MKIDNNIKSLNTPISGEGGVRAGKTNVAKTPASQSGGGAVELSPLASQLSNIEASLANTPVVDSARVEEIKQAIADGRFKVNTEVVADRLIKTVQELIQAHRA
jgi:negative regulator of flagellin synthesis FlgM